MSLIDTLSNQLWQEVEAPFSEGFREYLIARSQKDGRNYKYMVEDDDDSESPPRTVLLEGPADEKRDPLKGYRRVELLLTLVNNKLYITGIKNGGECVMKVDNGQI